MRTAIASVLLLAAVAALGYGAWRGIRAARHKPVGERHPAWWTMYYVECTPVLGFVTALGVTRTFALLFGWRAIGAARSGPKTSRLTATAVALRRYVASHAGAENRHALAAMTIVFATGLAVGGAVARQVRSKIREDHAYFESLEMELTVEPIGPTALGRAADLTQRTNQFNLAPRRFTRDELAAALAAPTTEGYIFGLRDRFGDHGLVAVAIIEERDRIVQIATLLMSCRVLKRTVEDSVLAFLNERARDRGASHIEGLFRRTAKNEAAAAFYRQRAFVLAAQQDDGTEVYRRASDPPIAASPFVRLANLAAAPNA